MSKLASKEIIPQPAIAEEKITVAFRIPRSIDRAVEVEAAHRSVQKQQLIEDAIRAYLGMEGA